MVNVTIKHIFIHLCIYFFMSVQSLFNFYSSLLSPHSVESTMVLLKMGPKTGSGSHQTTGITSKEQRNRTWELFFIATIRNQVRLAAEASCQYINALCNMCLGVEQTFTSLIKYFGLNPFFDERQQLQNGKTRSTFDFTNCICLRQISVMLCVLYVAVISSCFSSIQQWAAWQKKKKSNLCMLNLPIKFVKNIFVQFHTMYD